MGGAASWSSSKVRVNSSWIETEECITECTLKRSKMESECVDGAGAGDGGRDMEASGGSGNRVWVA